MKSTRRPRRSAAQWQRVVSQQAASALPVKILYFDHSGYAIWSKRLEQGRFVTRPQGRIKQALSFAELQCLLEGIDVLKSRHYKRFSLPNSAPDIAENCYNDGHA